MKTIKYLSCIIFLICAPLILSQDQNILIFDPNGVSSSFQYTLSQITEDSVFVADTIDNSIFNYDGLFLFLNYPYILSQEEGNKLIQYTTDSKPIYIYSELVQELDSVAFWNHIGVEEFYGLLISVPVDSVTGVETKFTSRVTIDTSFMSGYIPVILGNVDSILIGNAQGWEVNTTFMSGYDSLNVLIDLYNLIDDYGFLERVLQHFGLIPYPANIQIQFFPLVDTALIQGGCTTPEILCQNLVSTNERDSISIEPGSNTYFYYIDSSGYQIPLDNYYFIVIDFLDEYEYELWYHPKSFPTFNPVLIEFDSTFYSEQNEFDIQLIVKKDGLRIDSLSQPFHADFGLGVEENGEAPKAFSLSQNYPNPFNPITRIRFTIPTSPLNPSPYQGEGHRERLITLKVFDVLGCEVATLVDEEKPAGSYEVEFSAIGGSASGGNASSLPSGVYFYQLKADSFIETKKMILLK
jgi:hypothetical protein